MRKQLEKTLDQLWSAVVKSRSYYCCQMCGSQTALVDPHHVIKRTHKRLRWTLDNGLGLCRYRCHRLAEDKPKEFEEWFSKRYSYIWEKLNKIKQKGVKIYSIGELEEIEINLKKILKETGSEDGLPF